jgi:hypothetical protein
MLKFHLPNSTSSLIITIKHKAKYRFYMGAILLFYLLQKMSLYKRCKYVEDLLPYITSGP